MVHAVKLKNDKERTMVLAAITIAASLAGAYMEGREGAFPTDAMLRSHMNLLQKDFRLANPNEDSWLGFLPLLEVVVRHQGDVEPEVRNRIEHTVIGNFTMFAFAGASEDSMVKADFSGRLSCLELISRFEIVRRDTNALFQVAEHLSGAVGLSCDKDEEVAETLKADALDRQLVFGDKVPPRMYGDLTFVSVVGKHGRECRDKFRFRRVYNERLPGFRTAALRCFYSAIKEGYEGASAEERQAIWDEFCCRAKASADEKTNVEKSDAEKCLTMFRVEEQGGHLRQFGRNDVV